MQLGTVALDRNEKALLLLAPPHNAHRCEQEVFRMSPTTSYRLSGVALLIGGIASAASYVLSVFDTSPTHELIASTHTLTYSFLAIVGSIFVLLGLPGVYARQAARAGILGLLGFLFAWYVTLFQGVMVPFTTVTIIPALISKQVPLSFASTPPWTWTPFVIVSMFGSVLGILLLAIATIRAKIFPRWLGWGLVLTLVLGAVGFLPFVPDAVGSIPAVVGNLVIAGFGYALATLPRERQAQAQPDTAQVGMQV
jgi:hypothetical protein